MMRVLLDTNVVLDVLLNRLPWEAEAAAILQAARDSNLTTAVTSLSIANVFYVGRRHVGLEQAWRVVRECLNTLEILPVDAATLEAAVSLPGKDLEDSIQIAAAIQSGVDAIVTRDPAGFTVSPVPVLTPPELLAKLRNTTEQGG